MIHTSSTVQKKIYNKGFCRVGIENIRVGDYVRTINPKTLEYSHARVMTIVKNKEFRLEMRTSCFDRVYCTSKCTFLALEKHNIWKPSESYYMLRLTKRRDKDILTPFVKKVEESNIPDIFYDIIISTNDALLVDGYAKFYDCIPYEVKINESEASESES